MPGGVDRKSIDGERAIQRPVGGDLAMERGRAGALERERFPGDLDIFSVGPRRNQNGVALRVREVGSE
jgi:hypothetical protein